MFLGWRCWRHPSYPLHQPEVNGNHDVAPTRTPIAGTKKWHRILTPIPHSPTHTPPHTCGPEGIQVRKGPPYVLSLKNCLLFKTTERGSPAGETKKLKKKQKQNKQKQNRDPVRVVAQTLHHTAASIVVDYDGGSMMVMWNASESVLRWHDYVQNWSHLVLQFLCLAYKISYIDNLPSPLPSLYIYLSWLQYLINNLGITSL